MYISIYILLILFHDISVYRARCTRKRTRGRREKGWKKDPMSPSFKSGQSGRVGSGQVRDNNLIIILSYYYYLHHRDEIERETGLRRLGVYNIIFYTPYALAYFM